jgi:replicative DNA helicase
MINFLEEVEFGRKGGYKGLKSGLEKLDKFTNGIQKSTYTVIGAQQKTGKTAFVDHRYVLQPYIYMLNNPGTKIKWHYFSYEISELEKKAKFCAYFVRLKYGDIIDSNIVLSRGDHKLSDELHKKVQFVYENYVGPLFDQMYFFEERSNPTGIYKHLMTYAQENGKFEYTPYKDDNGVTKQRITGYKENDPDLYTVIILDHVGLVNLERGYTKKQNIDKLSSYFVQLRNLCKFSPVVLSQFNRDLGKTDRLKFSGEMLQPTMEDFKDTGGLGEDASLVMALFNPTLYPHIKTHLGYDLTEIGKGYRSAHILASRNTESGVNLALNLEGQTGRFEEL